MAYRQPAQYGQNNGYYDGPQSAPMDPPQEYREDYGQQPYARPGTAQDHSHQNYGYGPPPGSRRNERPPQNGYGIDDSGYRQYGGQDRSQNWNEYEQQPQPTAPYSRGAPSHNRDYPAQRPSHEYPAQNYQDQPYNDQRNDQYVHPNKFQEQGRRPPAPQRSYSDNRSRVPENVQATHGQASGKLHDRILESPKSPENLAWDNPFPTFGGKPAPRKRDDRGEGQRPATAHSQRSHNSGRSHRTTPGSGRPSIEDERVRHSNDNSGNRPVGSRDGRPSAEIHDGRSANYDRSRPMQQWSDEPRSRTMPNGVSNNMLNFALPMRGPGPSRREPTEQYHHANPPMEEYQPQPGPPSRANTFGQDSYHTSNAPYGYSDQQPSHAPQASYSEVFDSYYDEPSSTPHAYSRSAGEEDMPNFDAAPAVGPHGDNGHAADKALHLGSQVPPQERGRPDQRGPPPGGFVGAAHRSRSQPNLRQGQQPNDYGYAQDAPPMPAIDQYPNQGGYDYPPNGPMQGRGAPNASINQGQPPRFNGPNGYGAPPRGNTFGTPGPGLGPRGPPQGRGPGVPVGPSPTYRGGPGGPPPGPPSNGPSPGSRASPHSPPGGRPQNPDALPEHPVPVRPGLMQNTGAPQPQKPPPVRQYTNNSAQSSNVQLQGGAPPSQATGQQPPVTKAELDSLRQRMVANPSDQATDLLLARKMVEASTVLVGEGASRGDTKMRNKERERYILDAHKIIKKLVSRSYPEAMFFLADCHGSGQLGLQKDSKEAFNLYQSAAKIGHAQAAYRVAVCCEMGQDEGGGTRRDPLKAVQWYKRAATLGDAPAMYKIGVIQLKGLLGQQRNPREAVSWLKRAAERADADNPHALHELGLLYESAGGNDNLVRDEGYALELFSQAAELGYKFSQFRLGAAYEFGNLGCPINQRMSIAWYSKAAQQEEHQSELALSGWYLTGADGIIQQSDTEAYLWARKAATAGLAKAEYAMGYFTETGIGAPADLEAAKRWYWRAASQNFPKAKERLEDLRKGGARMQKSRVSRSAVHKNDADCIVM